MNAWRAFRSGLHRAAHYWQVWLVLYAANLLAALLLALLPALSLVSGPGHRPAIRQAADGLDAWLIIETLMSPSTMAALGQGGPPLELPPGLQEVVLLILITVIALPSLAWLPSSFLSGGMLLAYSEAPAPFGWRRFLWGCWHWFGTILLLGVIQAAGWLVVLVPAGILIGAATAVSRLLLWPMVALQAFWLVFWLVLLENSRVAAVASGSKNVGRAFGRALRFVFHRPLPVAGLWALSLLLAGLVHALYRLGLVPYLPLERWLLVFLLQQAFLFGRLGIRLVRLAGETALMVEAAQPGPQPDQVPDPAWEPS
jgi:hypothetical protein